MENNPVSLDFSKAQPLDAAPQTPTESNGGVTLDFSKSQPVNAAPVTTPTPSGDQWGPQWAEDASRAVGNAVEGAGKGVLSTASAFDDAARKHLPAFMTDQWFGFGKPADEQHVKDMATPNGTAQNIGYGAESLGEFLLGDEGLKGLALSERFARVSKMAKVIEDSPMLSRVFQAGVRALRGATVGATQGAVKSGGDANTAIESGIAGGVGNAVIPEAADAVRAGAKALPGAVDSIRNAIKPGLIQDTIQSQIRGIVNDAAKEYGVDTSAASSIRDVAQNVSDSLISKAKAAYQALDDASGGRIQRTGDAIRNVQKKIRELNGIDPDAEGAFIEKLNELQDAHEKIMGEMEEAGVPRNLLNEANSTYKKAKSMLDLNRAIRGSSEGLRPELASGAKNPIPESINTGKLFSRVQKLYDSGRLTDALGAERSKLMTQAANDAHAAFQTAQSWARMAKGGAKLVGLGSLPFGGYELVRHLLGE